MYTTYIYISFNYYNFFLIQITTKQANSKHAYYYWWENKNNYNCRNTYNTLEQEINTK